MVEWWTTKIYEKNIEGERICMATDCIIIITTKAKGMKAKKEQNGERTRIE